MFSVLVILVYRSFSVVGMLLFVIMGMTVDHIPMPVFMVMTDHCGLLASHASTAFAHISSCVHSGVAASTVVLKVNPSCREGKGYI